MVHLATGDYLIDDQVLVERKTIGDLRASLVDGRLYPQVARLSHSSYRSLLLIEGPTPMAGPDVHPHSIDSIAAMWRLPVLHSCDPEQSVRLMRFLADQVRGAGKSELCADLTGSRNGSRRSGCSCCRAFPAALRWRIDCCVTLAPSNASSLLTRLPWPGSEASARERPRKSASSSLTHRTRLTFAAPPGNDLY